MVVQDILNPPNTTIIQHHLYAVRVSRALRQDSRDNAFRPQARGLILFLHHAHMTARLNFGSIRYRQSS
jgi:hypothetical protein